MKIERRQTGILQTEAEVGHVYRLVSNDSNWSGQHYIKAVGYMVNLKTGLIRHDKGADLSDRYVHCPDAVLHV